MKPLKNGNSIRNLIIILISFLLFILVYVEINTWCYKGS